MYAATNYAPGNTDRYAENPSAQIDAIGRAYALAELPAPDLSNAATDLLRAEMTPKDAAHALTEGLFCASPQDATRKLDEALAQVARAQAAEVLRRQMAADGPLLARMNMPDAVERAVADLTPAFDKLAAELMTVAVKLDPEKPLDHDLAFTTDTSREVKRAEAILRDLATYAKVHRNYRTHAMTPGISPLLPIVELPPCAVEVQINTYAAPHPTVNETNLDGSRAVRALIRDARESADVALVRVAQGAYPGVRLALASTDDLDERRANAERADAVRIASQAEVNAYNSAHVVRLTVL